MEENAGEDDAHQERREGGDKIIPDEPKKSVIKPHPPADVTNCTDCNVNPSELFTESDTWIITTATNIYLGEGKEGEDGEEKKGGMAG